MRPELVGAVVDALLPGDGGSPALPSATAAGVTARVEAGREAHRPVIEEIARAAGGEDAFLAAGAARRADALRQVEAAMPDVFAALLLAVVEEYYDADAVLLAMGWPVEPPQPNGHPLPAFDEALVEKVRKRAPMWRDPRES